MEKWTWKILHICASAEWKAIQIANYDGWISKIYSNQPKWYGISRTLMVEFEQLWNLSSWQYKIIRFTLKSKSILKYLHVDHKLLLSRGLPAKKLYWTIMKWWPEALNRITCYSCKSTVMQTNHLMKTSEIPMLNCFQAAEFNYVTQQVQWIGKLFIVKLYIHSWNCFYCDYIIK